MFFRGRSKATFEFLLIIAMGVILLGYPLLSKAEGPARQQILVVCAASLGYMAMVEGRSGKGPKYDRYIRVGKVYTDLTDPQWRSAIVQVMTQMEHGQVPHSDIQGTAANCLRWHDNDEIKDLR